MPFPLLAAGAGAGVGAGAAGAAGMAAGAPWSVILPIAMSLLGGLFSEDPEEKKREDFQNLLRDLRQAGFRPPYRSPHIGTFDNIISEALAANMGRYSNWGFPKGMNVDLSFLSDFLANPGASRSLSGALPGTVRRG